jgi:hypothetical protein
MAIKGVMSELNEVIEILDRFNEVQDAEQKKDWIDKIANDLHNALWALPYKDEYAGWVGAIEDVLHWARGAYFGSVANAKYGAPIIKRRLITHIEKL